jgi:hypothetical protein
LNASCDSCHIAKQADQRTDCRNERQAAVRNGGNILNKVININMLYIIHGASNNFGDFA